VTTVDKYQGQQNDIALVSLVRTKAVGHVRDLRRLILVERPLQLELVPGERYPAQRGIAAPVPPELALSARDMPHMARLVYDMYLERVQHATHHYKVSNWCPGSGTTRDTSLQGI
ncbi:Intron-binding protein aquarius, partial [Operophtera brumata]